MRHSTVAMRLTNAASVSAPPASHASRRWATGLTTTPDVLARARSVTSNVAIPRPKLAADRFGLVRVPICWNPIRSAALAQRSVGSCQTPPPPTRGRWRARSQYGITFAKHAKCAQENNKSFSSQNSRFTCGRRLCSHCAGRVGFAGWVAANLAKCHRCGQSHAAQLRLDPMDRECG